MHRRERCVEAGRRLAVPQRRPLIPHVAHRLQLVALSGGRRLGGGHDAAHRVGEGERLPRVRRRLGGAVEVAERVAREGVRVRLEVVGEALTREQRLAPAERGERVGEHERAPRQLQRRDAPHRVHLQRVLVRLREGALRRARHQRAVRQPACRAQRLVALCDRRAQALDAVLERGRRHGALRRRLRRRLLRLVGELRGGEPLANRQ
mmetsp:Transcript_21560/g.68893  ORF Transcript_21560/g.68893 Transcript_21560/m.68893 type:complete len:207 (+) Transcript_21560:459-1079(+)